MTFPKYMYRTHPVLGVEQETLVATAAAARELSSDWSERKKRATIGPKPKNKTVASIKVVNAPDTNR